MYHPLLARIAESGVIATLRAPNESTAISIVDSLVEGGITAIEVTYTTPSAGAVIAAVRSRFGPVIVLGAGTLTAATQVAEAHAAGAEFLVSPGFDTDVVDAIEHTGALSMIGAFTATEVQGLAKRGVDVVKFFPGSLGGPAALRSLRGPFPNLTYIPTGGVSVSNLGDWFVSGAVAVGAGSELIPAAAVAERDFSAITDRAREFLAALGEARKRTE